MVFLVACLLVVSYLASIVTGMLLIWSSPLLIGWQLFLTSALLLSASFAYLYADSRISKAPMRHAERS